MSRRALVTGAGGMLSHELVPALRGAGYEVAALGIEALDVTDRAAVERYMRQARPDVVVQCAAYTAVDRAEAEEPLAFRVNAEGARNVARACQNTGALFVYPSTDYVFSGRSRRPYLPTDEPAPLNAYGRSKRAGEEAAREAERCLVVRTSWLYGSGGANFVDTITRLAGERERLEVVDDQVGRPTWTGALSQAIVGLLKVGAVGTFHATGGGGEVSWYGFAREILRLRNRPVALVPVPTTAFPRPAPRPAFSVLDCASTEASIGRALPPWTESLAQYVRAASGGL